MHRTLCIWLLSIMGQESAAAVIDSVKLHPALNTEERQELDVQFYFARLNFTMCNSDIDPDELFKDTDNDGVIDRCDKEPNSIPFDAVDIHGVSNDFDRDGCPDSEDPEPNSNVELEMKDCVNVVTAGDNNNGSPNAQIGASICIETPMIFFDLASSAIRPDAKPVLNHLSDVFNRYRYYHIGISSFVSQRDIASGVSALSVEMQRSTSVILYLLDKGIHADQIYVQHHAMDDLSYVKTDLGNDADAFDALNRSTVFEVFPSHD